MMHYIRFIADNIETLLEIDDSFIGWRQIDIYNDLDRAVSNCPYRNGEYILCEGAVHIECGCGLVDISKDDFEAEWEKANVENDKIYLKLKNQLIGHAVACVVKCQYPHGTILECIHGSHKLICIGNYQDICNNYGPMAQYPGFQLSGTVRGYDDVNRWLIIDVKCTQQVDSAEASTIAVLPFNPSGSPR